METDSDITKSIAQQYFHVDKSFIKCLNSISYKFTDVDIANEFYCAMCNNTWYHSSFKNISISYS